MAPERYEMDEFNVESPDEGDLDSDRPDLPPEYSLYHDEGCDLAGSCLNCPFSLCVYEQPGGKQRWLKKIRDRELNRLFADEGKEVNELAMMFGLSQRTVQRALRSSYQLS